MTHRILFVSQALPWPKDSGGNIRTYFMLAGLAQRFDVVLCSTTDGSVAAREGERLLGEMCTEMHLVPDVKRHSKFGQALGVLRSLVSGLSAVVQHNDNPALRAVISEVLSRDKIDALHFNHLDTTAYVDLEAAPPIVIDTHNLLFDYYERRAQVESGFFGAWVCRREARIMRGLEPATFRRARCVVVCSETERERLLALDASLNVSVVPNGVDCAGIDVVSELLQERCVVFVGDLAYGPNRDACSYFIAEILPLVQEQEPRARFLAVGKNPPQELVELGRSREDITVTGFVDDVAEWIQRAQCYVVPIRYGSGTRLKVLEAFAFGIPTVSTTIGAEGIEYAEGEDILIRDEPVGMAQAILGLFEDQSRAQSMASKARAKVEARYDWPQLGAAMVAIHQATEKMQAQQTDSRFTLVAGPEPDQLAEFRAAAQAGLAQSPKGLPCQFLYDARGSELFEEICKL
ncbi:MAG: glycosyltransferase involved in cell wall biosynthesis, partial [Candidatus Paceibacteria bacterium]